jgi:hypothetical protein
VDDEHLLALGRAVYVFQKLEWLTTCMLALVTDGDIDKYYGLTFGTLVSRLRKRLREEPSVGKPVRPAIDDWADSLRTVNTLRQDVFHSYPVDPNKILRRRRRGELIPIDVNRLDAARHRFDKATEEGVKIFAVFVAAGDAPAGRTSR